MAQQGADQGQSQEGHHWGFIQPGQGQGGGQPESKGVETGVAVRRVAHPVHVTAPAGRIVPVVAQAHFGG